MTLIVGIVCKDGVVIAADSQISTGAAKQPDANKISVVNFANCAALIAESGAMPLSNFAVSIFKQKAAGTVVDNEDTIARTCEEAVRAVRTHQMSLCPNGTAAEWETFFADQMNYFELMVAYNFRGKPRLYSFNPCWCIPIPTPSYFQTSGCGKDLANYILKEQCQKGMDCELGAVMAIKIAKDAANYVEGCGLPVKAAALRSLCGWAPAVGDPEEHPDGMTYIDLVDIFSGDSVDKIIAIVSKVESRAQPNQTKRILKALRHESGKTVRAMFKAAQKFERSGGKRKYHTDSQGV